MKNFNETIEENLKLKKQLCKLLNDHTNFDLEEYDVMCDRFTLRLTKHGIKSIGYEICGFDFDSSMRGKPEE